MPAIVDEHTTIKLSLSAQGEAGFGEDEIARQKSHATLSKPMCRKASTYFFLSPKREDDYEVITN